MAIPEGWAVGGAVVDGPPTEPVKAITLPPMFTPEMPPSVVTVLAGCGGIGARVAPMLIKLMRNGDTLVLIDHDEVENKNLARQHFSERQVGMPKVEAVAASIATEAERIGVNLVLKTNKVEGSAPLHSVAIHHGSIILSGFDNREARIAMRSVIGHRYGGHCVWIDGGNERRSGQVMCSLYNWRMHKAFVDGKAYQPVLATVETLKLTLPEMLTPNGADAPAEDRAITCLGGRVDDQTLAANALAATYMTTMYAWFRYEIPFSTLGVFFSTMGSTRPVTAGTVANHVRSNYGGPETMTFRVSQ